MIRYLIIFTWLLIQVQFHCLDAQSNGILGFYDNLVRTYQSPYCPGVIVKHYSSPKPIRHETPGRECSNWDEAELIIVTITQDVKMRILDFRREGTVDDVIGSTYFHQEPVVILSGGFYSEYKAPIGHIIINGKEVNALDPYWEGGQGGVIAQKNDGEIRIISLFDWQYMDANNFDFALQSLPIVIEYGENAIFDSSIQCANRIGIGRNDNDDIVLALVVAPSSRQAVSLYELGILLSHPTYLGGPGLEEFIALDGGPSVYLKVPRLPGVEFGRDANHKGYIPNMITIEYK